MIRHHIALTFVDDSTRTQHEAVWEALRQIPGAIPGAIRISGGLDLGLVPGNAHLIFHIDFSDIQSWESYTSHPVHQEIVTTLIKPILAQRVAIQTEISD